MTVVPQRSAPVFPPGVDRASRLMPLYHGAVHDDRRGKSGQPSAKIRRDITRRDPLLFAMMYLPRFLMDEETGQISFSEFHLAAYDRALRWTEPVADRSGWASHRDAGKSVVWFLVLPLWALAHGHRRFFLALSNTGGQVKTHLGNLKEALEVGGMLLYDFPHLTRARPWTAMDLVTVGGQRFTAAGMEKTILGLRHGAQRPDLIVGDDLEPGPKDWTPASKAKTLGRLEGDVLPAGARNAAVVLTGTPVGMGSVMHDVVRAARGRAGALEDRGEWLAANEFDPYWFPAILDEGTGRERSAWPTRWPLSKLYAKRAASPRTFALQRMCDPDDPAAQRWWTEGTFRVDARYRTDWRIGSIDGAVTSNRTDVDHTAFVTGAVGPGWGANRKVFTESAESGSWSRAELREHVWKWAEKYPRSKKTLIVETNQGGQMWAELLDPLPPGVVLEEFRVEGSKRHRIESHYDEYVRGVVWHAQVFPGLRGQLVAWKPGLVGHSIDDLIDAESALVRRALYGDAGRAPVRRAT